MNSLTHVTILTGASRGLGLAIAQQVLARGGRLLTLQRHPNAALAAPVGQLEQWVCDLTAPEAPAVRLAAWVQALPRQQLASLTLINNAAGMTRVAPLGGIDPSALAAALRLGLEAPTALTAAFLGASQDVTVPRKVLLVSSGLARRAIAGGAVYCAAKAGLDHLARAVALEEAAAPHGARIVSLAPGVIDTDMQAQLRDAQPSEFPDREHFVLLKAQGRLDSPQGAAAKVLAYLDRADFGSNPVADVRDPS